jgi:hypothetical protein
MVGGVALWTAGCCSTKDSNHEHYGELGHYGSQYYTYDYYPDVNVYFSLEGRNYYWYDGHWKSGARLPDRYVLREENRQRLRSRKPEPWTDTHERRRVERDEERGEHQHYGEIGHHDF